MKLMAAGRVRRIGPSAFRSISTVLAASPRLVLWQAPRGAFLQVFRILCAAAEAWSVSSMCGVWCVMCGV
jgi:hypothetical protein